ncbi:transcriptional regulator SplA domain-containing protein [Paenibacillus assamensis]|uniref:transcriptional regulator SplA domain-containing protein n=1 Tax=Paenibacillus assamensis TaxID=311244 RepID=UPI000422A373|nr:transcriptional regulator SplA domain-containing protein [Paenibacillus assamensis]
MEQSIPFSPGQIVYVIIRNPHSQDVANVQQAAVVHNPEVPSGLALFLYETYYPLTNEVAVYSSLEDAEFAYQEAFGMGDMVGIGDTETYYG